MRYRRFSLLSLSSLALALYAFFATGSVQLMCERLQPNQVTCEQTSTKLYGLVTISQTTLELFGARVELVVYNHDVDGSRLVRDEVWLETSQGTLTFPSLRYNRSTGSLCCNRSSSEAKEKAEQIHQYIQGEGAAVLDLDTEQTVLGQIAVTIVIVTLLLLLNWLLIPQPKEYK
jgi:hypothetical protein